MTLRQTETQRISLAAMLDKDAMYDRLGHIVRQLHDSLRELGYDRSLTAVVTEVADATDRLEYIATLTEKAANVVLNTIEEALPRQDAMIEESHAIQSRWHSRMNGLGTSDDFRLLARETHDFSVNVARAAKSEKEALLRIMMAQDFQDITGQIIKRVVVITQKLERELAQLLVDNAPAGSREHSKPLDLLAGPDGPAVALAQDDVDDLLADLGF